MTKTAGQKVVDSVLTRPCSVHEWRGRKSRRCLGPCVPDSTKDTAIYTSLAVHVRCLSSSTRNSDKEVLSTNPAALRSSQVCFLSDRLSRCGHGSVPTNNTSCRPNTCYTIHRYTAAYQIVGLLCFPKYAISSIVSLTLPYQTYVCFIKLTAGVT